MQGTLNKINIVTNEHGYVLPYILITSLLLITIMFGLITVVFFNDIMEMKKINRKKIELACFSAVQELMTTSVNLEEGSKSLQIGDAGVLVNVNLYGFYYDVTITGSRNNDSVKVKYIIANKADHPFENAVILSRPNLRASVAGATRIKGNILGSSNNFTRGSIFGIRNLPGNFIEGEITTDDTIKTKLYLDTLFSICRDKKDNPPLNAKLMEESVVWNSNPDTAAVFIVNGDLKIEGQLFDKHSEAVFYVKGNTTISASSSLDCSIKIYSDSSVTIEEGTRIKNLFVYAAKDIEVNECIMENVQILSERDIYLTNSRLNYPSVAAIRVDATKAENLVNSLDIENCTINGTLALVSNNVGLGSNKSKILIDDKSKVQGLVYSENLLEAGAKVEGIIYAYSLYYYKEPTQYINWMVNLNVDRSRLSKSFLLPVGFSKVNNYEILEERWIY